jgi:GNAT superfamily N-acetyltransferase
MESRRNEIILYTDHQSLRLAGIFPEDSDEALFGFWETTGEAQANVGAFALLAADAAARSRKRITGPLNFNTFHSYRLRLNVPSWNAFDREPVNPEYYPSMLEGLGYSAGLTFESRLLRKEAVPDVYLDKKALLEALRRIPFDFIPVNVQTWRQYEGEIFGLVHHIFSGNPAYKPVPEEQFRLLYNADYAAKLCPHSSVLFRDRQTGKLAAMSFCHPDYHSLADEEKPVFERDFPRLPKKVLLAKSVGVHPAFRRQGLMSYLGAYAMLSFSELYDEVLFCLMRSGNFSLTFSDGFPHETARYALFGKELG